MNAVRIRTRIESETLHLPELSPMIGREVEIIVLQEDPPLPGSGDFSALAELAGKDVVDPEAYKELRARSMI